MAGSGERARGGRAKSRAGPPEGAPRLACRCIGVSSPRVARAVRAAGLTTLGEVQRATGAGTGCGTCHPELEEILAACRGRPIAPAERARNRAVCAAASAERIGAAVDWNLARLLPAGASVELIAVEGLRAELCVRPKPDASLARTLARELRKRVCADLEVLFS